MLFITHKVITVLFIPNIYIIYGKKESESLRIIGGVNDENSEYPYVVSLEYEITKHSEDRDKVKYQHLCTASALTSIWTLTAGHCVVIIENNVQNSHTNLLYKAILRYNTESALLNLRQDKQQVDILEFVLHNAYSYVILHDKIILANDVGLLRSEPMRLKTFGKLSAIDHHSLIGHEAVIAGYGLTNSTDDLFDFPRNINMSLQIAEVMIKKCVHTIRFLYYPMICLAGKCQSKSHLCSGDSGGPLVHSSGIIGVHSLGSDPDKHSLSNQPVGYDTAVSPYIDWIVKETSRGN